MRQKRAGKSLWRCAPAGTAPIDPLPEHGQLRRGQTRRSIGRRGPGKAALLENLVIETKPLAIKIEDLDPIAATATKRKDRSTGRLVPKLILDDRCEARDPFPHISDATGQVD